MQINALKIVEDKDYDELCIRYFNTLRVLGELASRVDPLEIGYIEEVNDCMNDAKEFVAPVLIVTPYEHFGFSLETKS